MKILTENPSLQSYTMAYVDKQDMPIWRTLDKNWRIESATKEIIKKKKAVMTSHNNFIYGFELRYSFDMVLKYNRVF